MSRVWDPSITALQRRVLTAGAVDALGKISRPASVFALFYLALTTTSPYARFLAPIVGAVLGLLLVAAMVVGLLRARHSRIYLAKWIDKTSGLDDRLASSVEWSQLPAPDPFQQRCIEQLSLQLQARTWSLVLPRTRPEQWPLTLAALLVIAMSPIAFLRRAHVVVEHDALTKAVLAQAVSKSVSQQAAALVADAKVNQDPELEKFSMELTDLLQNIDQKKATREDTFRQLDKIRAQIKRDQPRAGG